MIKQWQRIVVIGVVLVVLAILMVQLAAAQAVMTTYVSAREAGETEDGVVYDPYDIVGISVPLGASIDAEWFMFFEGEDWGLNANNPIAAIAIDEEIFPCRSAGISSSCSSPVGNAEAIYLSFDMANRHIPGIAPKVAGQDVVVLHPNEVIDADFTEGYFEMYFDGSDVGLTGGTERIDGLDVWREESGSTTVSMPPECTEGLLFISTKGSYRVTGTNGALVGDGSDVLIFCATNLGVDTAGFWLRAFDSSELDVKPRNSMSGIDVFDIFYGPADVVDEEPVDIYFAFTARQAFTSNDAFGGPSEIFGYPDCGETIFGPIADLNDDSPALNGTVTGFDLINSTITGACGE